MRMTHLTGWLGAALLALNLQAEGSAGAEGDALIKLSPLPYATNALEPTLSGRTLTFHYGKHHKGYVDKLNELTAGTPYRGESLEAIIRASRGKDQPIFNNAAQVWNHTFFWNCMKAGGGGMPAGTVRDRIEKDFGGYDAFRKAFVDAGVQRFGSGYVWLVDEGGKLAVTSTGNADTPIADGQRPLLTCDVWEHAYYLDFQNRRKDFLEGFLDQLANWDFVQTQLK